MERQLQREHLVSIETMVEMKLRKSLRSSPRETILDQLFKLQQDQTYVCRSIWLGSMSYLLNVTLERTNLLRFFRFRT